MGSKKALKTIGQIYLLKKLFIFDIAEFQKKSLKKLLNVNMKIK